MHLNVPHVPVIQFEQGGGSQQMLKGGRGGSGFFFFRGDWYHLPAAPNGLQTCPWHKANLFWAKSLVFSSKQSRFARKCYKKYLSEIQRVLIIKHCLYTFFKNYFIFNSKCIENKTQEKNQHHMCSIRKVQCKYKKQPNTHITRWCRNKST